MNFSEFLESSLLEAAGSLAGLPKVWVKEIVGYNGNGGENSQIVLFKSNAKQKDLTAAIKKIGGVVKAEDKSSRWSRSYTQAELQAKMDKDQNAGVLVKVNGEWAFFAKWNEYGTGAKNFMVWSHKGKASIKTREKRTGKVWNAQDMYREYNRTELTANELGEIVGFDEDVQVDVYIVTADAEREMKRQERKAQRGEPVKVSPERKAAVLKFLQSKASFIVEGAKKDVEDVMNKINSTVEAKINQATKGIKPEESAKISDLLSDLNDKLKTIDTLGHYISDIVEAGTIKDRYSYGDPNERSYSYKSFMKVIKEFEI